MDFSNIIKELREERNINQKEFAKIIHLDNTLYNKYENNYTIIPLKYLIDICNYFNVSLDYILGFTNIKKYKNTNINNNNNLIGKRLKEFRKENKLTQKNLAFILNTTQSVIAGYESLRYLIATPFLYEICKKYHISADYLLGRIDHPKYI